MFSELIDRAVHITGRPDSLTDLAYAANETMRDMSKRHDWDDDALEALIPVPDPTIPTQWVAPEAPLRFRREEYVEYDDTCEPTRVKPSRRIRNLDRYYYRSADTFIFVGAFSHIKMFYYAYQPWLQYYPTGARPSVFDGGTQTWSNPLAIPLVANWMLMRHNETVMAGTLTRFFAAKSDPRQKVHYAQFEQRVKTMIRSEGVDQLLGNRHG